MKYGIFCVILLSLLLPVFLTGCMSTEPVLMDTVTAADREALQNIELNLISYAREPEQKLLDDSQAKIVELDEKVTANREFHAKLLTLKAELLFYTGSDTPDEDGKTNIEEINDLLGEAGQINPQEEGIYIVRALIENNLELKIDWLIKAENCRNPKRAYLELGNEYFRTGQYKKAVSAFDKCINNTGDLYKKFIDKKRDMAYSLIQSDTDTTDGSFLALERDLTIDDFVKILYKETSLLDAVIADPAESDYLPDMQNAALFAYPSINGQTELLRKDAAYLVAAVIAKKEGNPDLLEESARDYKQQGWKSPIPDVQVADKYFSAVVMMVEYEIMELPDGEKFFPGRKVTPKEVLGIISQLKKLYP